jgi:hypothetical protein
LLSNGGGSARAAAIQIVFGNDLDLVPIEPMVLVEARVLRSDYGVLEIGRDLVDRNESVALVIRRAVNLDLQSHFRIIAGAGLALSIAEKLPAARSCWREGRVLRNYRSRKQKSVSTMRTELLRFNGALERDPAIDAWIKEHAGGLGAIAHQWFEVMRKCGDEVRELLHDGCPVACLGDAPFGYVNVFNSHVNVGFFTA